MHSRFASIVGLLITLFVPLRAHATEPERIALKPHMTAGLQYNFVRDEVIDYAYAQTIDDKEESTHTNMKVRVAGRAQVLESVDGFPTLTYISFDRDSTMLDTRTTDAKPLPYTLAGRKYLVRFNRETGEMTADERLEPAEAHELRRYIAGEAGYYPTKEIAIGDTWNADAETVARNSKLSSWNTTLDAKLKLIDVKVVDKRRVAEIDVELTMSNLTNDYNTNYATHAKLLMDLETGQCTRCEAETDYKLISPKGAKNEWGDIRTSALEGNGKSSSTSQITYVEETPRSPRWCGTTR